MLGQYHGMSAQLAFHDESQWREGLEKWEVQERRCLYWSIYTLDVFASSVWGSVIGHRSCQSFVSYPDHRLDDALSLSPTLAGELDTVNWIQGWNTVTDLYRAMEKIMDAAAYQNQRAAPHKPPDLPIPFGRPALSVIEPTLYFSIFSNSSSLYVLDVSVAIAFRAVAMVPQVSGLSVRARGSMEEASLFVPWEGVGDGGIC
ncbi:fungal specific transcription factor [Cryptococcus neoformans Bt1]|nr:fungal specific transcription factor [Cryptococcus neoformans var. grubii Bt1]